MGNRNSIEITYHTGDKVYLYSHWGGSELHTIVNEALEENRRIGDESYFARILFSKMIAGDEDGETGFGIAPYVVDHDSGNRMVHVDYTRKRTGGITPLVWVGDD